MSKLHILFSEMTQQVLKLVEDYVSKSFRNEEEANPFEKNSSSFLWFDSQSNLYFNLVHEGSSSSCLDHFCWVLRRVTVSLTCFLSLGVIGGCDGREKGFWHY